MNPFLQVSKFEGHTLYDTKKLAQPNSVLTLKEFKATISQYGAPQKPIERPEPPTVAFDLSLPDEFR